MFFVTQFLKDDGTEHSFPPAWAPIEKRSGSGFLVLGKVYYKLFGHGHGHRISRVLWLLFAPPSGVNGEIRKGFSFELRGYFVGFCLGDLPTDASLMPVDREFYSFVLYLLAHHIPPAPLTFAGPVVLIQYNRSTRCLWGLLRDTPEDVLQLIHLVHRPCCRNCPPGP